MIYDANSEGPFLVDGFHDPDSERSFTLIFKPDVWLPDTVYERRTCNDYDFVIATEFTGVYFRPINPGKSGPTEPSWNYEIDGETTDGTKGLVWETQYYNFLPIDVDLSIIVPVVVTGSDSNTITTSSNTANKITFTVPVLNAAARNTGYFDVLCHYTLSTGLPDDRTVRFTLGER